MQCQPDSPARDNIRSSLLRPAVVLFSITLLLHWGSMYVYVPILPVYARSMGASLGLVGLLVGSYGFSQMVLRIPIGIVSDRLGRRKPFLLAGLVAVGVGSLGLATTPIPEALVIFRGIVGVGAATYVASSVLFASYFRREEATRAMSLLAFTTGLAQVAATGAGGRIADDFGWNAPFYVGTALAFIGFVCAAGLPDSTVQRQRPTTARRPLTATMTKQLLAVSLICALLMYVDWATTYAFVPVFAADLGATNTELGILTVIAVVAFTGTTLVAAPITGLLGERSTVVLGMFATAVGAIAPLFTPDLLALGITRVFAGIGRGIGFPVLMGLTIRAVPSGEQATAMGVFQAIYAIGMFAGPATAGVIADSLGIAGAFSVSAVLSLLGALVARMSIRATASESH